MLNNSSLGRNEISYQLTTNPDFSEKLIAKISNPINVKFNIIFYEPLTILQRSCEKFFYKEFYKNNISLIENDIESLSNDELFNIQSVDLFNFNGFFFGIFFFSNISVDLFDCSL